MYLCTYTIICTCTHSMYLCTYTIICTCTLSMYLCTYTITCTLIVGANHKVWINKDRSHTAMFIITKLCYYYVNSIHTNISNNALKEYVTTTIHKYYKVRPASQLLNNNYIFYSIWCVGFVAVVISIRSGEHYHLSSNTSSIVLLSDSDEFHVALFPSSIEGAITCISYCSLCFICHFNLFAIERELYRPKKWKMNFIIVTSMVTAYLIYNVVGFAGYIQVRSYPPV